MVVMSGDFIDGTPRTSKRLTPWLICRIGLKQSTGGVNMVVSGIVALSRSVNNGAVVGTGDFVKEAISRHFVWRRENSALAVDKTSDDCNSVYLEILIRC